MWQAFLLQLIEWLCTKAGGLISTEISSLIAKHKEAQALANNQTALQGAIKSGDQNAIDKAGADSLNNTGGT